MEPSEKDIKKLREENSRLRDDLKRFETEIAQCKTLVHQWKMKETDVINRERTLEKEFENLERTKTNSDFVRKARLAEVEDYLNKEKRQLRKERQQMMDLHLHKAYHSTQNKKKKSLKQNLEQTKIDSSEWQVVQDSKNRKLKASLSSKCSQIRLLNSKNTKLTTSLKQTEKECAIQKDKQLQLGIMLEKSLQQCALLRATEIELNRQLKATTQANQKKLKDVSTQHEKLECGTGEEIAHRWEMPDGSVRNEYKTGKVVINFANGDEKIFDPVTNKTQFYFKQNNMLITT